MTKRSTLATILAVIALQASAFAVGRVDAYLALSALAVFVLWVRLLAAAWAARTIPITGGEALATTRSRFLGKLIDCVAWYLALLLIAALPQHVAWPAFWVYTVAYFWLALGLMEGLTGTCPGKLVLGMEVHRTDGSPRTLGSALLRNVIPLWLFWPAVVESVIMHHTARRQRGADLMAHTVVAAIGPHRPS